MKNNSKPIFGPKSYIPRYLILFLACISSLSVYYSNDIPALVRAEILSLISRSHPEGAETYFNMMYTLYALPNIILPMIAGALIDRFGYSQMNVFLCGLVSIGNMIMYIGITHSNLWLMLAGRFIYGCGAESLILGIGNLVTFWFKGKDLCFSQALSLTLGRAGTVLSCYTTPILATSGLHRAYNGAIFVSFLSMFAAGVIAYLEEYTDVNAAFSKKDDEDKRYNIVYHEPIWDKICNTLSACKSILGCQIALTIFYYLTFYPFNMVTSGFLLQTSFSDPNEPVNSKLRSIGHLLSIPLSEGCFLFPLFGYIADRFGYRLHLQLISSIGLTLSFILIKFDEVSIALIIFGISYAIFASLVWPVLTLLTPQKFLGTLMGIVISLINFSMTVFPLFLSYMETHFTSPYIGIDTLLSSASISIFACLAVWYYDNQNPISVNSTNQTLLMLNIEDQYFPKSKFEDQELEENIEINC